MTDDLDPTTTLPTALPTALPMALHELAESDPPRVMDVEKVLRAGKHSVVRRRMAALGGGTAVLAATGLAVGVLAPAGSAGHRDVPGPAPAASTSAVPAPTTSRSDAVKEAYVLDPRDPVMTNWQPGYLPPGMTAFGGTYTPGVPEAGAVEATDPTGFEFDVAQRSGELSSITQTVPAQVQGAKQAFWYDYGHGSVVAHDSATLAWQRSDGQWMLMHVYKVSKRTDWQAQMLEVAAQVKKADRSLPMPFSVTRAKSLHFNSGAVSMKTGSVMSILTFDAGPEREAKGEFRIMAFKIGSAPDQAEGLPGAENVCENSNGLTICVNSPVPEPTSLAAIGGAKALLAGITSLGNDPANWTTDVLQ
ncbi:hypothetical protein KGQ20_28745 [Catenulispora sp. NF23]|uniref:Uncharacterized protein n=1 Tax=Catenulispora pinistramenti TaxID=2705254 RepID=A0ABS5KXJ2_9ACTN|nr:hypothetical protein [Catenulispora pinistramenti]MBS2536757.1 hypothetical protein [Catenulispora pinistramenti]MBS2550781.1 hypothetical protein [Catenulispora pinistramenti]